LLCERASPWLLTQKQKGKTAKMEKPNHSIKTKPVNPAYAEIIELLKSGGEKIKKDLRKSRQIRFCSATQMAREHLQAALETVPDTSKVWHIQFLMVAIQNVICLLYSTQKNFHSKELMRIRESAENLLKEANEKYKKAIKKKQ
jgi:hypothetical protein